MAADATAFFRRIDDAIRFTDGHAQTVVRDFDPEVTRWIASVFAVKKARESAQSKADKGKTRPSATAGLAVEGESAEAGSGKELRILSVLGEHSRECLALHVARQLTAADLIAVMAQLVARRGVPSHIRSDNGSEFVARTLQSWLADHHVQDALRRTGQPLAERARGKLPRIAA